MKKSTLPFAVTAGALCLALSWALAPTLSGTTAFAGEEPTKSAAATSTVLDAAMKSFKDGDFAAVVTLLAKVPEKDPARPKALYLIGESELARGDAAAAAKAFRAVLETRKDSVPALTGLGRALTGTDEKDAAEKSLRRAVSLDAKDVNAACALGEFLTTTAKYDEARKVLEAARKLDPKEPLVARALVEACIRGNDTDAAAVASAAFQKAVPDSSMALFLKALVLDRKGEVEDAIAAYEKVIAKDDRFLDAHKNLAILCTARNPVYSDLPRLKKAYAHYEKYFALGGKDPELKTTYDTIRSVLDEFFGEK